VTYEYVCTGCGHQWEAEQKITDPALTECPACKQPTAKRLVSGGTGHVLVGAGWAKDGYGSHG
jgi:putative FmdB family regulatory protein